MFNNRGYLEKVVIEKRANIAQQVLKVILLSEILSVYMLFLRIHEEIEHVRGIKCFPRTS